MLKDGDRLLVPRVTQEVTVIGEVQSATSHLYRADLSRDDYIAMSGGLTPRADDDRIYVVRADGSVVTRSGNAWFSGGGVGHQDRRHDRRAARYRAHAAAAVLDRGDDDHLQPGDRGCCRELVLTAGSPGRAITRCRASKERESW